jgi:hypothetical protein
MVIPAKDILHSSRNNSLGVLRSVIARNEAVPNYTGRLFKSEIASSYGKGPYNGMSDAEAPEMEILPEAPTPGKIQCCKVLFVLEKDRLKIIIT